MQNVLFVCLDSCRYDTFMAADTPNMDKIGKARKAYSFACFTQVSMMGYFIGYTPIGEGHGIEGLMFPHVKPWEWIPKQYADLGYTTAWFSANPVIHVLDKELNGGFSRGFDLFKCMEYERIGATEQIVEDAISVMEDGSPFFISMLLLDTHSPFFDGIGEYRSDYSKPSMNFYNQKRAVEYTDRCFGKLMKKANSETVVIITSDHGEQFGPIVYDAPGSHSENSVGGGHDPRRGYLRFGAKLFEIPFVKGKI